MIRKIAKRRIEKLLHLAFSEKDEERAKRYVELAKKISIRNKVRIPKKYKRLICKNCLSPLIPGKTAIVRVEKGKIVIKCLKCGSKRIFPYK